MASSEYIPSTLNEAVVLRRTATHPLAHTIRPNEWVHFTGDFTTISIALISMRCLIAGVPLYHLPLREIVPSTISAGMIVTICAFVGAYSTQETPLNIGNTTGLVKGFCCAAFLICGNNLCRHDTGELLGLTVLPFLALLLVVQREAIAAFTRERRQALVYFPLHRISVVANRSTSSGLAADSVITTFARRSSRHLLKRTVDVCAASLLLVLLTPLFLIVVLAIRWESRGSALLRQRRIGEDGIPFYMWKFRSMYAEAPRYALSPTSDIDPRLTKVGRIIRRFSIDELPQLLNVLVGDMSLVGPRPEMPFIVAHYTSYERLRLNARPGMTGLWQISPARAMPIHKNVHLDLFYIQHESIFLDLAIMLRTVTATVRGIGAA